jgi:hypothetical protein
MIFTGLGTSLVGSHSDMRVIENTIDYMIQEGTPSNKIVIGLGAYAVASTLFSILLVVMLAVPFQVLPAVIAVEQMDSCRISQSMSTFREDSTNPSI